MRACAGKFGKVEEKLGIKNLLHGMGYEKPPQPNVLW
jgi:hypothetical protein